MNLRPAPVLLAAIAFALHAGGQEWTRFRGPNGSGVGSATHLPAQWTEADHRWKLRLPGGGHSSPVLWGDRVFVTCADAAAGRWRVVAVDATQGTLAWQKDFPLPAYPLHRNNTFATATAAVDAERVYVARVEGMEVHVTALTLAGEPAWDFNAGPFQSEHGFGHSPIRQGRLVILSVDHDLAGRIFALEAATGRPVWETPRRPGHADYSTPCLFGADSGSPVLVFNTQEDGISAVEPEQGRVVWSIEKVLKLRSVSSPVAAGGLLFGSCGSGGGGNYVVAVQPPGSPGGQARVAYEIRKAAPYVPTPLALGELLFLWSDGGIVTCVDAATGKPHWQERAGGDYFSSPVCADGKLYGVSTTGEVVALAAAKEFRVLGRSRLGEASEATPAIAGGRLYFRTLEHLICVGGNRPRGSAPVE